MVFLSINFASSAICFASIFKPANKEEDWEINRIILDSVISSSVYLKSSVTIQLAISLGEE